MFTPLMLNISGWYKKTILILNTEFHKFNLFTERSLEVVVNGVPIDITDDEMINILISLILTVKHIRRFGTSVKPLLIYLLSLVKL